MKSLRVIFDVDGLCGNFIGATLDIIKDVTGQCFHHDDVNMWDITQLISCPVKRDSCIDAMNSPGFCTSIEPYDGSIEAFKRIKRDHNAIFVTAPFIQNKTWMPERVEWLCSKFGVSPDDVNFVKNKYIISGDVIVEDNPHTASRWLDSNPGGLALLWNRKYNIDTPGNFIRVSSWSEVVSLINMKALNIDYSIIKMGTFSISQGLCPDPNIY